MPFKDFDVYWTVAQAILRGVDPYAVPEAYYPLPFYFIFLPLAALPLPVAHVIWTTLAAIIFVSVLRRRAIMTIFFVPVLLTFLMGQILMPMLGLFALLRSGLFGGVALALLLLKPHLVIFLAPWQLWRWWNADRRQLKSFALTLGAIAALAFAVQPDWIVRWLSKGGERLHAALSPSLWGTLSFFPTTIWIALAGSITALIVLWAYRESNFDLINAAGMLVNPVIISYDLTLLTIMIRDWRAWVVLTLLSWISFGINAWRLTEGEGAFVLTTLVVLIIIRARQREVVSLSYDKKQNHIGVE